MELVRGKSQINVQKEFEKLSLKLRKTSELTARDTRAPIPASYGVGRKQAATSNDEVQTVVDYEPVIVESTDGIFSFEIMTDKALIPEP